MIKQLLIFLQEAPQPVDNSMLPLMMGFFVIFMVFFVFLPQRKRMKAAREFMNNLEKGQDVVTSGGIHGKVSSVQDTTVVISTDAGKLKVEKTAVSATYTAPRQ